jgi:transcriptional regulator with XRE-family HTH domain
VSATVPWKPLPRTLGPECRRFVTRLRELKDEAGVSLAALAERTAYSRSSWDRCLHGRALPPPQAVEVLCRLAGQPAGPVLALRDLAELTWGRRPAGSGTPAPDATPAAEAPQRTATADTRPPARTEDARPARDAGTRARHSVRVVAVTAVLAAAVTLPLSWWLAGAVGRPAASRPAVAVSTAQVLCAGRGCGGESPKEMWCATGSESVVRKRLESGAFFEVRYRAACGAAWGRMWFSRPGDRLVVTLAGERYGVTDTDPGVGDQYHVTPMLATDSPRGVTACYVPDRGPRVCIGG